MKRVAITLVFGLAITLLQGCGFHLRGKVDLAPSLSAVYVKSADKALQVQVEDMLRASGSNTVTTAGAATAILKISGVKFKRVVRTVDTRGKATGYLLTYSVGFDVVDRGGESLLKTQALALRRDYDYDPTLVLVKESEERFLRSDMERDAAQQIVRRLATISK